MNKILRKANIWDLHIHTPLGTKTRKNYGGVSAETFVDEIIKIYSKSENEIGMISFTDHNKINVEAYDLFRQKSDIAIIPGIEVDVFLNESAPSSKHVIFYFDETELDNLSELKEVIEEFIENNPKVYFEPFVLELIYKKKRFAISPHAFKQDKRGIDYDWFDETAAEKGTTKFSGLFFPFWEAGGKSDICKAIEFINEQYGEEENKQAVIAFSDSADYDKLKKYIENPYQYFLCLNSFKGLLLAGSDRDRIIYKFEDRPEENPSQKIKSIVFSDNLGKIKNDNSNKVEIELSDRLNVIVGGRGKGKSALLDAIVYAINDKKIEDRYRLNLVKKFHMKISNFNDNSLPSDTNILYFSQAYINKLFDGKSQEKLGQFFEKQFSENIEISDSISDIKAQIESAERHEKTDDINVSDDLKNIIYIGSKSARLNLKIKRASVINLYSTGEHQGYFKVIKSCLPKDKEIWDDELENLLQQFIIKLLYNIAARNYKKLLDNKFTKIFNKKMEAHISKKSKEDNDKVSSKKHIEQKIKFLYEKELERIRQINKLYEIEESNTSLKMQYSISNGENNNKFYFVSIANKEHPVEYAKRMIIEATNRTIHKGFESQSIEEIFKTYATTEKLNGTTKDSTTFVELISKISDLRELKSKEVQKIIYKQNDEYTDLHNTSPGTQTNAVMEFILHADSTVPLLIDQPEDNIDNEARYAQLTRWIRTQKYKRQIILVTHDANIVINGDAECVIIANHTSDKFSYEFGALEYGDILDKSAIILDGGKDAIHRRIEKYGE